MLFQRHINVLIAALILALPMMSATAQEIENPIKWSLKTKLPATPLKVGDQFVIELTAQIERGWHLYSTEPIENGPKPTHLTVPAGQAFELAGEIQSPAPFTERDPNFGVEVEFYEESVTFTIPIRVLSAGSHKLLVQVRYQTCTQQLCLPPKLLKFETPVEIAARDHSSGIPKEAERSRTPYTEITAQ